MYSSPHAASTPSVARVAVLLGTLVALTVFGSSAVAVALPSLGRDLDIGLAGQAWVLAALSLTFSIATAVFGRLADIAGLRLPLRIGIILFALGAATAGLAQSFPVLLAGRLIQGAGAGAVPVLSLGIIAARFEADQRARALAGLVAIVAVISGSGPFLGGAVTQFAGWRWILAVPVLSLVFLEPVARLAPDGTGSGGRLDVPGAALVASVVVGLVLLLQAPAVGAGPLLLGGATSLFFLGGALLVRHVRHRPDGFLPRRVISNGPLLYSAVSGCMFLAAYLGLLLAVPQLLSGQRGWSPLEIGLALVPGAAVGAMVSRLVGSRALRFGRYRVVALLGIVSATGLVLAGVASTRPVALVLAFAPVSAAFAGGQVALVDAISMVVAEQDRGLAIGLFNLVFFTGGAVGSAATAGLAGMVTLPGALLGLAVLPLLGSVAALAARHQAGPGLEPAPAPTPQ